MGVGVSNWRLAQAVSKLGELGVVSGTALDSLFVRRLADGDPGGHMRRALDAFPSQAIATRIRKEFFVDGGKAAGAGYPVLPMQQMQLPRKLVELCMVSSFVEVFLAREGHTHPVGINFLEKVQMPHLPAIYGAMLAGVGYILMGAGIPLNIPGVLDAFAAQQPAEYRLSVTGAAHEQFAALDTMMQFDPADYLDVPLPKLHRPKFLAIVSSNTLAATVLRRSNGQVDGLVIEGHTAGGHNAPPRGKLGLNDAGEPVYGERDMVDVEGLRKLGVPFWLAGGYGTPAKIREALDQGAAGVQLGTAFALSEESGLRPDFKQQLLAQIAAGTAVVFTDPLASPTGFPFKVAQLEGTSSSPAVYRERTRVCDLGYLREPYATGDNGIGYRCSAEPVKNYLAKGGNIEETVGRKCLCNALLADIGYAQIRPDQSEEPALVTVGEDLSCVAQFMTPGHESYSAAHVIEILLGPSATA